MAAVTTGIRATNIQASFGEIRKLKITENSIMLGARTRYLTVWMVVIWIVVTSVVSRVIKDAVPNCSRFSKEKV